MNKRVKKVLETSLSGLVALLIFVSFAVASASAQSREAHVISARAGGVNFVSGDVKTRHAGEVGWQRLTTKDDLQTGDEVRTGADGRVEVLLNPGSYFRAGESTQFELVDASLDNLGLRITHGSAVIEATGYDDKLAVAVATPQAHVRIVRAGIYRFRVTPEGVTEVAVYKGRVLVGDGGAARVTKSGYVVRLGTGGGLEVAKLDKRERDALDLWSRDRGKELAKLNEKLANQQVNSLLARASFGGLFSPGYSYGGVWVYSPRLGCFTFLPFYGGWSSPYGFSYGSFWSGGYYAGCGCGGDRHDLTLPSQIQPPADTPTATNPGRFNPGSQTMPGGQSPASQSAPRTDVERGGPATGHGKMINPPR